MKLPSQVRGSFYSRLWQRTLSVDPFRRRWAVAAKSKLRGRGPEVKALSHVVVGQIFQVAIAG